MSSFAIKRDKAMISAEAFEGYTVIMNDCSNQISQVANNFSLNYSQSVKLQKALQKIASDCEGYKKILSLLSGNMNEIIRLYSEAESKIVNNSKSEVTENPASETKYTSEILESDTILSWEEELLIEESLSSEDSEIWDYILRSLKQIIMGNFTEDSTLVGIIGSVLVGCIPIVGQIADVRDILGDIYQLCTDGAETNEWISLVVDVVALIPLCDLLKYSDEALGLTKYLDDAGEALEGIIDYTCGTWKKADDIVSQIDDLVDEGAEFISDVINKIPDNVKTNILKTTDKLKKEVGESTVGGVIRDIVVDALEVEDRIIDSVSNVIDNVGNSIKSGVENIVSGIDDFWNSITINSSLAYV